MRFIFHKNRAHCENKYTGPITIFRQMKGGLYAAMTEKGELIRVAKRDIALNVCSCECHTDPGIMHFVDCCNMTYEQHSDLDTWLTEVLANPEIQYA